MSSWLAEADRLDRALYAALADADTPRTDAAMRRLSRAADYSKLSIAAAGVLALMGPRGRRAAVWGLCATGVTAAVVNVVVKPLGTRPRPDREGANVPSGRHVAMPVSTSFPSGHTAAAVAFAEGAGRALPPARAPLLALAAAVGYSRVHTGVHYPGDVLAGAALGAVISDLVTHVLARHATPRL